jgi:hypothetical protein
VPHDFKSLHRFIGFISYFRKFIVDFNKTAGCLYDLLRSKLDFTFNEKHLNAFNELRLKLLAKPVLSIFSPDLETQLHTDASSAGFGSIIMQRQPDDNKFHPVFYYSRKTTEAESRLHSFELEVLAVVYSLQRFRNYLFGLHFTLITDCKAMKLTLEKRDIKSKIARWSMFLEDFDFEVVHRKNERMQHVDALSRLEVLILEPENQNVFENSIYINQILGKKTII